MEFADAVAQHKTRDTRSHCGGHAVAAASIKTFIVTSPNSVMIRIWAALIAC